MKAMRRTTTLARWAGAMLLAAALPAGAAEAWRELPEPVETAAQPGRIEVAELFWYGCNHCDALDPLLRDWVASKPEDVEFVRIPAVFSDQWLPLARAYYSMQLLGLGEKAHAAMFDAIHRERRNMNSLEELEQFFAAFDVAPEKFRDTFNSFAVDTMVRRAIRLTRDYRITGVPAMAVAGRYVTSSSMAGGHEALLEVVDELVAKARTQVPAAAAEDA